MNSNRDKKALQTISCLESRRFSATSKVCARSLLIEREPERERRPEPCRACDGDGDGDASDDDDGGDALARPSERGRREQPPGCLAPLRSRRGQAKARPRPRGS